jgi:hypothetical protein
MKVAGINLGYRSNPRPGPGLRVLACLKCARRRRQKNESTAGIDTKRAHKHKRCPIHLEYLLRKKLLGLRPHYRAGNEDRDTDFAVIISMACPLRSIGYGLTGLPSWVARNRCGGFDPRFTGALYRRVLDNHCSTERRKTIRMSSRLNVIGFAARTKY